MLRTPARIVFMTIVGTALPAKCTLAQSPGAPPRGSLEVAGGFAPSGPPSGTPVRVDAGGACVVDVSQTYDVDGTLNGVFDVDFRILVDGPCGSPPGMSDEEWIALGRFSGTVGGQPIETAFTYTATVRDRGEIHGLLTFGPEVDGMVEVRGRFADGRLGYTGWVMR